MVGGKKQLHKGTGCTTDSILQLKFDSVSGYKSWKTFFQKLIKVVPPLMTLENLHCPLQNANSVSEIVFEGQLGRALN